MVAYKTDPLGLNDTVTPSSGNAAAAGSQNHHRRSFRHGLVNRLTVKKNKGNSSSSRGVAHGSNTTNTRSSQQQQQQQQQQAVVVSPPSTERRDEDAKSAAVVEFKNDPNITTPTPTTIHARPAAGFETTTTLATVKFDSPPVAATNAITNRNAADQNNKDDEDAEEETSRPVHKFLQRFSRCCPRHDELAANEKVLMIVFVSFSMFTVSQMVLAFAANSLSLLGDTAAMIVDCVDYGINIIAERRKTRFDLHYQDPSPNLTPERAFELRERAKRKAVLFWEVVPPALSVLCLVGVTTYVLQDSIRILIQDFTTKPKADQNSVDLTLVLTMQLINLSIDIFNFTCFAKIHRLRGFHTMHQPRLTATPTTPVVATENDALQAEKNVKAMEEGKSTNEDDVLVIAQPACKHGCCAVMDEPENSDNNNSSVVPTSAAENKVSSMEEGKATTRDVATSQQQQDCCADRHDHANLNMCSAYTHVLADSMRTISILVAVILAMLIEPITAEAADSAAAVVVSVIILVTLVPLVRGLVVASRELFQIAAEEKAERASGRYLS